MFGWGIEGKYVKQRENQGTDVQSFEASDPQKNYTTVDYNPVVVACQDKAYEEYFGESKLDETTRREILDDSKDANVEYQKENLEKVRKRIKEFKAGPQGKKLWRKKYENFRESEVEASKLHHAQMMQAGIAGALNFATVDRATFCRDVLNLSQPNLVNLKIYQDCVFAVPQSSTPLSTMAAIEAYDGPVHVYVGISGQLDRNNRPLQYIAKKFYGGLKQAAEAQGWQHHYVMDVMDKDFYQRRFNMQYAERNMQMFFHDMKTTNQRINTHWSEIEPAPLKNENLAGVGDNELYIGMYICLLFGDIHEE